MWLLPSPAGLLPGWTAGVSEVSRFSCMKLLGVPGVFDYAGLSRNSRWRSCPCCLPPIWELSPSNGAWTETVLHRFTNRETPWAGVTFDGAGNLYGTTVAGGIGYGTVYELTPSGSGWNYQTLYEFQGRDDGFYPEGGVVFDAVGNLYGTTSNGSGGGGSVFEMQPSGSGWTFTTIYNYFPGPFGPQDTPTLDAAGNIYGTVFNEGYGNFGVVFKLTPSGGGWTEYQPRNLCEW